MHGSPPSGPQSVFRRLVASALILGFVASGCGGGTDIASTAATTEPSPVTESALIGRFASLDGTTVDLESFQGQDVVLWFWAPW